MVEKNKTTEEMKVKLEAGKGRADIAETMVRNMQKNLKELRKT